MSHVVELRRVMDWVYSTRSAAPGAPVGQLPLAELRGSAFRTWYEGDGRVLSGNQAFEAMRVPNLILTETYEQVKASALGGASPQELEDQLKKLAHYSMVLIGDLLRLESELLLGELKRDGH